MLSIVYAEYCLCCVLFMLSIAYAEYCLCCVLFMLSIVYDECCLCRALFVLSVVYSVCCLCCELIILGVIYAGCHTFSCSYAESWLNLVMLSCYTADIQHKTQPIDCILCTRDKCHNAD
jgi:hypothetical protein